MTSTLDGDTIDKYTKVLTETDDISKLLLPDKPTNSPTHEMNYELKSSNKTKDYTLATKFLTSMDYGLEDMTAIFTEIHATESGKSITEVIAPNMDTLKVKLKEKLDAKHDFENNPLYILYRIPEEMSWVLVIIVVHNGGKKGLYKNIDDKKEINAKLQKYLEEVLKMKKEDFLVNTRSAGKLSEQKRLSDYSGATSIRFLLKAHEEIQNATLRDEFIKGFKNCDGKSKPIDLNQEKLDITKALAHKFKDTSNPFLDRMRKEVNTLKSHLTQYSGKQTAADAHFEKIEGTDKYKKTHTFLSSRTYIEKLYPKGEVKKTKEALNHIADSKEKNDNEDESADSEDSFYISIEEEFPSEIATLRFLSIILGACVEDDSVKNTIEQLNKIFGMPEDWFQKFLKLAEEDPNDGDVEISIKIDSTQAEPKPADEEVDSKENIINGIKYRTGEKKEAEGTYKEQQNKKLKDYYGYYENNCKKYETFSIDDIQGWAGSHKHLKADPSSVCEALAVINRAIKIKFGFNLRYPQICACLVMLLIGDQKEHGKLLQIKTGEGKTVTIGALAIILVLQGYKVDVITSNNVLANEGANETAPFTNLFNISVGCNEYEEVGGNIALEVEDLMAKCPYIGEKHEEYCKAWFQRVVKYKHDIVYGCISNFQFDYLKDTAENADERKKRPFHYLILDEVDNMLIDNAGHIAKLAEPFPGMDSLRYVYINIWRLLNEKWQDKLDEIEKKTKPEIDRYKSDNKMTDQDLIDNVESMVKKETKNLDSIKNAIIASNPWNLNFIPSHIKEYAQNKTKAMVEMACLAKWGVNLDENYIFEKEPNSIVNDVLKVVPVDNANTGVILHSTIWSNGLHQFVQLKHNMSLTFESLTSSYISNMGYINKYTGKLKDKSNANEIRIFGVTGTLGSDQERELLNAMFKLEFVEIPPFKKPRLTYPNHKYKIIGDESWAEAVAVEAYMEVRRNRAVLIICNTIKDAKLLEGSLIDLKELVKKPPTEPFNIRTYWDEKNVKNIKDDVAAGDIIVASNLAGRGTDFKPKKEVADNGGMHVIVGFLPCNKRVQDQAFGRTGRKGAKGTAILIIRRSEITNKENGDDFTEIEKTRDNLEITRLIRIQNTDVPMIKFKDELFELFANMYSGMKLEAFADSHGQFLLRDLKEEWAFWLENQNFDQKKPTSAKDEFETFNRTRKFKNTYDMKNKLAKNPYYDILRVEHYLGDSKEATETAGKILDSLAKGPNADEVEKIPSYHMFRFEHTLDSANQMLRRLQQLVHDVLKITPPKSYPAYKTEAKDHLKNAKECFDAEMKHLKGKMDNYNFWKYLLNPNTGESLPDSKLVSTIENRYNSLQMFKSQCENLIGMFEISEDKNDEEVSIDARDRKHWLLNDESDDLKLELSNLVEIGLDTTYSIKMMRKIEPYEIEGSLGLIGCGLAFIAAGLVFLPAAAVTGPIGVGLISEGLIDILMLIITADIEADKTDSDKADYIRDKVVSALITVATAVITAGIGLVPLMTAKITLKVAKTAAKVFKKFLKFLETLSKLSEYVKIPNQVTKVLGKSAQFFGGIQKVEKFSSRIKYIKSVVKGIGNNLKDRAKEFALDTVTDVMASGKNNLNTLLEAPLTNVKIGGPVRRLGKDNLLYIVEQHCANDETISGIKFPVISKDVMQDIVTSISYMLCSKKEPKPPSPEMSEQEVIGIIKTVVQKAIARVGSRKLSLGIIEHYDDSLSDLERTSQFILAQCTDDKTFENPSGLLLHDVYKAFLFSLLLTNTTKLDKAVQSTSGATSSTSGTIKPDKNISDFIDDQKKKYKVLKTFFANFKKENAVYA